MTGTESQLFHFVLFETKFFSTFLSGDCRDGAVQCEGTGEESEDCNTETCPDWTPWSEWTECSQVRCQSVRWGLMFACDRAVVEVSRGEAGSAWQEGRTVRAARGRERRLWSVTRPPAPPSLSGLSGASAASPVVAGSDRGTDTARWTGSQSAPASVTGPSRSLRAAGGGSVPSGVPGPAGAPAARPAGRGSRAGAGGAQGRRESVQERGRRRGLVRTGAAQPGAPGAPGQAAPLPAGRAAGTE